MKKVKLKPLDDLQKRIKEFYQINTERKALEKREDALRDYFKKAADGKPTIFYSPDLDVEVPVTLEERTSIDAKALRLALGEKVSKYEKSTTFWKVAVRKVQQPEPDGAA